MLAEVPECVGSDGPRFVARFFGEVKHGKHSLWQVHGKSDVPAIRKLATSKPGAVTDASENILVAIDCDMDNEVVKAFKRIEGPNCKIIFADSLVCNTADDLRYRFIAKISWNVSKSISAKKKTKLFILSGDRQLNFLQRYYHVLELGNVDNSLWVERVEPKDYMEILLVMEGFLY